MEEIKRDIEKSKNILILTHHNSDIDAIGSSLALHEILKKTDVGAAESVSRAAKEIAKGYNIIINPDIKKYDTLIILDTSSSEQLKPINVENFNKKIIIIDHHIPGNLTKLTENFYINPDSTSASEIIYKMYKDELNTKTAQLLLYGIVADTSHLRMASPETFRIVSGLLDKGKIKYSEILKKLYNPPDFSELVARIKAASRITAYRIGEIIVVFSVAGSFESACARSLLNLGADISVVANKGKNNIRISSRCKTPLTKKINLAEDVFSKIGEIIGGSGGGHDAAGSANGTRPENLNKAFNKILELIEKKLGEKARRL